MELVLGKQIFLKQREKSTNFSIWKNTSGLTLTCTVEEHQANQNVTTFEKSKMVLER